LPTTGSIDLQLIVGFGKTLTTERDADVMRAGSRLEFDVLQAGIELVDRATLYLVISLVVLFSADHGLIDDLVVERHHPGILVLHAIAPDVAGHVGDVDVVFPVRGEIRFRENAASCAKRQSRNVRELIARSGFKRPTLRARITLTQSLDCDPMSGNDV